MHLLEFQGPVIENELVLNVQLHHFLPIITSFQHSHGSVTSAAFSFAVYKSLTVGRTAYLSHIVIRSRSCNFQSASLRIATLSPTQTLAVMVAVKVVFWKFFLSNDVHNLATATMGLTRHKPLSDADPPSSPKAASATLFDNFSHSRTWPG